MTQDTRKDRRAKIVSLNVRYKSATVDEFIDNHSHDVSKGGLFIKTSSPFPPGTLLKFEIRISGDKAVIAGVGRVVWKRETAQAGAEVPAGMGVKFIKIDDASRAVIDRLVESRGGEARNAYDEGVGDASAQEASSAPPPAPSQPQVAHAPPPAPSRPQVTPAPPPAPSRPQVAPAPGAGRPVAPSVGLSGLVGKPARPAPAQAAPLAQEVGAPFRPAPSASKIPAAAGKSTMMGLGGIQDAIASAVAARSPGPAAGRSAADDARTKAAPSGRRPALATASGAVAPKSSVPATSPMFPQSNSEADMPPKNEQTVMKQAAELLEEALLGAGGSMDEIGQNPLFDLAKKHAASATTETKPPPPAATERTSVEAPSAPKEEVSASSPTKSSPPKSSPSKSGEPEGSRASAEPPKDRTAPVRSNPVSDRPRAAASSALEKATPKNKWLLPLIGVAGAGVLGFLFYSQVYAPGTDAPPEPTAPSAMPKIAASPPPSAPPPVTSAEPAPEASSAPGANDAGASDAVEAAAPAPNASAAASTPVKPPPPPPAYVPPRPPAKPATPPPAQTNDAPVNAAPPAAPADKPSTAPTPTTATDTQVAPAPAPFPKPPPTPPNPAPKKADDDNPY